MGRGRQWAGGDNGPGETISCRVGDKKPTWTDRSAIALQLVLSLCQVWCIPKCATVYEVRSTNPAYCPVMCAYCTQSLVLRS